MKGKRRREGRDWILHLYFKLYCALSSILFNPAVLSLWGHDPFGGRVSDILHIRYPVYPLQFITVSTSQLWSCNKIILRFWGRGSPLHEELYEKIAASGRLWTTALIQVMIQPDSHSFGREMLGSRAVTGGADVSSQSPVCKVCPSAEPAAWNPSAHQALPLHLRSK